MIIEEVWIAVLVVKYLHDIFVCWLNRLVMQQERLTSTKLMKSCESDTLGNVYILIIQNSREHRCLLMPACLSCPTWEPSPVAKLDGHNHCTQFDVMSRCIRCEESHFCLYKSMLFDIENCVCICRELTNMISVLAIESCVCNSLLG